MSYEYEWPDYVPVAERRREAERALAQLKTNGHLVAPVRIEGRQIAATFWGKAWCDNLESYRDFETRLPRGRSYLRNGAVVDLQIEPGEVTALVSGSSLYQVSVAIAAVPKAAWQTICRDCAGRIDSLVELLQGRLSSAVMERLCRQRGGLFPKPADIRFSCTCVDFAAMCKHVAAALYGIGARLDKQPELLFRLRAVDANDLLAKIDLPLRAGTEAPTKVLEAGDVSAIFGLDLAEAESAEPGGAGAAKTSARKTREAARAGRTVQASSRALANAGRNAAAPPAARKRAAARAGAHSQTAKPPRNR